MCELVEDITQLLALRYSAKNVECCAQLNVPEFKFEVTSTFGAVFLLAQIFADALRLRQVITNLATNAMKFTDEGHVTVSAELVELDPQFNYAPTDRSDLPHLLFKVKDTGIGMTSETMLNLFQRFYQSKATGARQVFT